MKIRKPVINTMDRVGLNYKRYQDLTNRVTTYNRFSGQACETSALIAECINKIYSISKAYDQGNYSVNVADFDRLRYFVSEVDPNAYNICVD